MVAQNEDAVNRLLREVSPVTLARTVLMSARNQDYAEGKTSLNLPSPI